MPDLGYQSPSGDGEHSTSVLRGNFITMTEPGAAGVTLTFRLWDNANTAGDSVKACIFDTSGTLLAESAVRTDISTEAEYTFSGGDLTSFAPANATTYYICVVSTSTTVRAFYDNVATPGGIHVSDQDTSTFGPPAAFSAFGPALNDTRSSIAWMTYTSGSVPNELIADQGSFTLTGQAANLGKGYTMAAAQGSYAYTGSAALVDRELDSDQGSFTLTGQDATLARGYTVVAEPGAYVLVGPDAILVSSSHGPKVMVCDNGTYTITGQDASLRRAAMAIANYGVYNLSGFAVVGGVEPDLGTIATLFRVRRVKVVPTTGRTKWVHYIPVQRIEVTPQNIGTFNQEGAVEVMLADAETDQVEWVDYIPVVEVADSAAGRWRYDNAGWIPIVIVS